MYKPNKKWYQFIKIFEFRRPINKILIFKISNIKMAQETPQFIIQDVPMVNFSSFFSDEDTTQNLKKFVDSVGKEKSQDDENYYWPTEIDPNAQEVIAWAIDNSTSIFPNLTQEEKNSY